MRTYPWVGCYWPDPSYATARTTGNFVIVEEERITDPASAQRLFDSGLGIVLNVTAFHEDLLRDPKHAPQWPAVVAAHEALMAAGLRNRLLAVIVSDEVYANLHAGRWNGWPSLQAQAVTGDVLAQFRDGLSQYANALRGLFGCWVGGVDNEWNEDRAPAPNYDFLGLDVYQPAPWRDKAARDRIRRVYRDCWQTYHKPILAVPQAFGGLPEPWSHLPTVEQLRLQVEAINECPGVIALAWYALDLAEHRGGPHLGLAQRADRLRAAQWYAQFCGTAKAVQGV